MACAALATLALVPPLYAEGLAGRFEVRSADLELKDGVYHLNARIDLPISDAVRRGLTEGVSLVAAGRMGDQASREVAEIVTSGLVTELSQRADVVVADLPPLLGSGMGPVAARAFEDLLLVVRAGVTPVARVKEASADLHVEPNVLLNGAYSSLPRWLRRLLGQ